MREYPRRRTVVIRLLGFVVVFGGLSWVVTGGFLRGAPPAPQSPPTPRSTPEVADCGSEIQLVGAFNDCAFIDRTSVDDCAVTADTLQAAFRLDGTSHDWHLSLWISRTYPEPGDYYLGNGGGEVDVTNDATGAVWKSVSGIITTSTPDGRSGRSQCDSSSGGNRPNSCTGTDPQRQRIVALLIVCRPSQSRRLAIVHAPMVVPRADPP